MATDFTIILPVSGNLELATTALTSVLRQEGCTFRIIVCDDSKDDAIEQYISNLNDSRITHHHNRPPHGAVRNWNFGLKKATEDPDNKYIILLHHDERLDDRNHLTTLKSLFEKGYDNVIADVLIYKGSESEPYRLCQPWIKKMVVRFPTMLFAANMIGPTACIAFKATNCKLFNEQLHWYVDVDWYVKLLKGKKSIFSPSVRIISSHGHEDQITSTLNARVTAMEDSKRMMPELSLISKLMLKINMFATQSSTKEIIKKALGR